MKGSDLAVRRHERYLSEIIAQVVVAPASVGAVRISRSAVGVDGSVTVTVTDFSGGGLGFRSPVFFPSACQLKLSFQIPTEAGPRVELIVRIQRVTMADRKPTYYLGGAFENPTPAQLAVIASVLAALKDSGADLVPEKSRA